MKRLYIVIQSLNAKSADSEAREFKPDETLWCDLNQSGGVFKFEIDGHFEWFVDRQTFEVCCVVTTAPSAKPS